MNSTKEVFGKILCKRSELDLFYTLLGGQSFRWAQKTEGEITKYIGVASNCFWELWQSSDYLEYKAVSNSMKLTSSKCDLILQHYFRLDVNLAECYERWKLAHNHFKEKSKVFRAVRILDQEPLENVFSFICSQNNNIKRISSMVNWLSSKYGSKICTYDETEYFSFPSLESIRKLAVESELREAKFGYRAKFIVGAAKYIESQGGEKWLRSLRLEAYEKVKEELLLIPGVGPKVADCICLMSLNHLQSVPVDTHIYKLAREYYLKNLKEKVNLSRKTYESIAQIFRDIYGNDAGWAQTVLFCSDLKSLQDESNKQLH